MSVGGSVDNYLLINPNSAASSTRYWVTKRHFRLGMFQVKFLTTHLPDCSIPGPSLPRNWRLIPPGVWARAGVHSCPSPRFPVQPTIRPQPFSLRRVPGSGHCSHPSGLPHRCSCGSSALAHGPPSLCLHLLPSVSLTTSLTCSEPSKGFPSFSERNPKPLPWPSSLRDLTHHSLANLLFTLFMACFS